eukprot:8817528-Pyramimonas_sp.AAC.3
MSFVVLPSNRNVSLLRVGGCDARRSASNGRVTLQVTLQETLQVTLQVTLQGVWCARSADASRSDNDDAAEARPFPPTIT